MTAALATLVFLTTIWGLFVVGSMVLEHSGTKILGALKGEPQRAGLVTAPVRVRRISQPRAMRAQPQLRAAA